LSTKALKTCKAISKIASGSLTKKKKHLLWVEKKRNNVLYFGREKKMLLTHRLLQKNLCLFVLKKKTGNHAKRYQGQKL
jgi:hypothetical protein